MPGDLSKPTFLPGKVAGRCEGRAFRGPLGSACLPPVLRGGIGCAPGEPDGEKLCLRFAEFPGLLMKSKLSAASWTTWDMGLLVSSRGG